MRYGFILFTMLIATAPAFAATSQTRERPGQATLVTAKRATLDQVAKASRPSAPRRFIPGNRAIR